LRRVIPAALAVVLIASPAHAQQGGDRGDRHGPPRDHVFKMLDAYFVGNLKERLDLTDEQLARLMPHVRRHQDHRRQLAQRRFRAMVEMRRVLLSGTATEAAVLELLREVKAVEAEEPATLRRDMEAIDAVLTPVQQAKYRLLEAEVERRIRRAMSRSRGGARGRQGREGRPPSRDQPE
jgi:Spy/CpxP family protein refolding chaperone